MTLTNEEYAVLVAAGIPITANESAVSFAGFEQLVPVVLKALTEPCEPKVRDAIRGWLLALRDHYPPTFQKHFQDTKFLALLNGAVEGRDIKLRRIALSHLGKIA